MKTLSTFIAVLTLSGLDCVLGNIEKDPQLPLKPNVKQPVKIAKDSLGVDIMRINGRWVASLTNTSKQSVGVSFGRRNLVIRPGKRAELPFVGGQATRVRIMLRSKDPKPKWRMKFAGQWAPLKNKFVVSLTK